MKKLIAIALMLTMLAGVCALAEEAKVMTHADFAAAELETEVVVETYVQAKQGWWDNKATIYTQAEDGAYFIYNQVVISANQMYCSTL